MIQTKLLTNPKLREAAFRLRGAAYREFGVPAHFEEAADQQPGALLIGAYWGLSLKGVMRLNTEPIPCSKVFPEVLELPRPVEVSRFAIEPSLSTTDRTRVFFALARDAVLNCLALDAKTAVVTTQRKLQRFYEHSAGFRQIGAPRTYWPADDIRLLALDFTTSYRKRGHRTFLKISDQEVRQRSLVLAAPAHGSSGSNS
jgi:hypothetical protein